MVGPVTRVLVKVFAYGFYRVHSGLLLFLFVVIFSHCFWMKPLGGHLTQEQSIYHHLIMLISFASDPTMMTLVFISWMIYTYKSWEYVSIQLKNQDNLFLFYSITSLSKIRQFNSWFIVQLIIALPAVVYGVAAIIIGVSFTYYLLPGVIFIFLLSLNVTSAMVYTRLIERNMTSGGQLFVLKITNGLKKPLFSLPIYHVLHNLKFSFVITKVLTLGTLLGMPYIFSDLKQEHRLAGITILLVAVAHSVLIFQNHQFEVKYLSFSLNFPYRRIKAFLGMLLGYIVLTIPECIAILSQFSFSPGVQLLLFNLGLIVLFKALLYKLGLQMYRYLKWVFFLFILSFLIIVFEYFLFLPPLALLLSYFLFYQNYYRQPYPSETKKGILSIR